MALSDEHIIQHVKEFSERYWRGDYQGGGHAGMSLGIYCGLLAEPPRRVADLMIGLRNEERPELPYFSPYT